MEIHILESTVVVIVGTKHQWKTGGSLIEVDILSPQQVCTLKTFPEYRRFHC